jgi:RNA polymerase sigma factor (sigma-70 family)
MSLQSITDKQLIDSYLSGSHSSFEILINRHNQRVFSYILFLVKDRHLAEDLFQDVFIKVINSLRSGNYQENGNFVTWVQRIAHNLVIDHGRVSKHIRYIQWKGDNDLFDFIHMLEQSVEDKMIMEQFHKNIKTLLDYLPSEQKEVIVMRHFFDMSYKEIAEKNDINQNTARSHMRNGLILLRKINKQKRLIMSPKHESFYENIN